MIDNLERALQSRRADRLERTRRLRREGVALVLRGAARQRSSSAGVEAFDPTGEQFDPDCTRRSRPARPTAPSRASCSRPLEKGYRLDGQVLRPARVVVSE